MSWLYGRPVESTLDFIETKFARRPEIAEANTRAFKAGVQLRRDERGLPRLVRGQAGQARAGRRTATSPATRRSRSGSSPPASRAGCRSSSARTRSRRPRRSSRSSRATSTSASARSRPRTRSRPPARRSAPRSAARSASAPRPGPGVVLKAETVGLGVTLELPLLIIDVQRAGPVDRHADEAGAGRPADGAVRPQLGVAGAGARRVDAGRLLRHGDRGGADRAQVPDAGLPALRRVPRERLRAVADPGRRHAARHLDVEFATTPPDEGAVPALRARPGDARAPVGDPGHAGPRAPDRRAREGGRRPATSPTTPTTTT